MSEYWTASRWNQKLSGFCESELETEHEITNTITSSFVIFWGIYGLYQLPSTIHQTSDMWILVYTLLICVGFGSVLFHWTLYVGYGLMDCLPMLLAEFVGLFQLIEILLRIKLNNKYINLKVYDGIVKSSAVFLTLFGLICIIFTSLYGQHHPVFIILFALPPFFILCVVLWGALDPSLLKNKIKTSSQYKLIFRHVWVGFGFVAFAGIIWNIGEQLCDDIKFMQYLPLHGFWHFAIGYGMYNLVQTGVFVDCDIVHKNKKRKMAVRTKEEGKNVFGKMWYCIVPVLYVEEMSHDEDNLALITSDNDGL